MNYKLLALLATTALVAGGSYIAFADKDEKALAEVAPAEGAAHEDEHASGQEHETEETGHDEGERTTISAEAAKTGGIAAEEAGAQMIRESLPLTGKVILNPSASAEIKARFAGVVRKVEKVVGQSVKKGEVLAYVESNDSLQTYAVTSPLSGVVLSSHASVGDTAADEAIFVVADLDTVMAEFHVFPNDLSRIQKGQTVQVQSIDGSVVADGEVKSLLPTANADTQTVIAWVLLPNIDGRWRPGMAVQGGAVVNQQEVPVAVKATALQTMKDATVLFVQEGADTYEARPVTLGRSDGNWTEVLSGLEAGEKYVSKNSFVVKADIEKAGAEHEH